MYNQQPMENLRSPSSTGYFMTMEDAESSGVYTDSMNDDTIELFDDENYEEVTLTFEGDEPEVKFSTACRLNSHGGQLHAIKKCMNQQSEMIQLMKDDSQAHWQETRFQNQQIMRAFNQIKVLREDTAKEALSMTEKIHDLFAGQCSNSSKLDIVLKEQERREKTHENLLRNIDRRFMGNDTQLMGYQKELEFQSTRIARLENMAQNNSGLKVKKTVRFAHLDHLKNGHLTSKHGEMREINHDRDCHNCCAQHKEQLPQTANAAVEPSLLKDPQNVVASPVGENTMIPFSSCVPDSQYTSSLRPAGPGRGYCDHCGNDYSLSYLKKHMALSCPVLRKQRVSAASVAISTLKNLETQTEPADKDKVVPVTGNNWDKYDLRPRKM